MMAIRQADARRRGSGPGARSSHLPEKKASTSYFEPDANGAFLYAPAGQVGYARRSTSSRGRTPTCASSPWAASENGAPHFMKGMYGSFTVS